MSTLERTSETAVLPGALEQPHNALSDSQEDIRPESRSIVSDRFRQLLQDLQAEHLAVTAALCEELRVAKGVGSGASLEQGLDSPQLACHAKGSAQPTRSTLPSLSHPHTVHLTQTIDYLAKQQAYLSEQITRQQEYLSEQITKVVVLSESKQPRLSSSRRSDTSPNGAPKLSVSFKMDNSPRVVAGATSSEDDDVRRGSQESMETSPITSPRGSVFPKEEEVMKACNSLSQKWAVLVAGLLEANRTEIRKPREVWTRCQMTRGMTATNAKQVKARLSKIEETFALGHMPANCARSAGVFLEDNVRSSWELECQQSSRCIAMDPHSPKRLSWAVIGMLFILYDFVMVPMQAFDLPSSVFLEVLKWMGQIFWTMDIFVNFFTAVYVKSHLKNDLVTVARIYATTWLSFDVLVTLPTYLPLFIGNHASDGGVTQGLRTMRVLRFMRLLRLAKFRHLLQEALEVINSPSLLLGIGMLQQLFGLILWNHVVACIWYFTSDQVGTDGWTDVGAMATSDVIYRYLSALHWVLSQYQGTSEIIPVSLAERAYAVVFLQVAIIILALFLSTLTNLMRQLQDLHQEKSKLQRSVRAYLNDNKISSGLSVRVKKYMDWQQRIEERRRQDEKILLILPDSLTMDLMVEVRQPMLAKHAFFDIFCKEFVRICRRFVHEAMTNVSPAPSETVFAPGDSCRCMYWVTRGELRYFSRVGLTSAQCPLVRDSIGMIQEIAKDPNALDKFFHSLVPGDDDDENDESPNEGSPNVAPPAAERVADGFWLSEAVLWTDWEHCGELVGMEECCLLTTEHLRFAEIVAEYRPAHIMASVYARRFVGALQRTKTRYTDLIDNESLFHHEAAGRNSGEARFRASSITSDRSKDLSNLDSVRKLQSKGSILKALNGFAQDFFESSKSSVSRMTTVGKSSVNRMTTVGKSSVTKRQVSKKTLMIRSGESNSMLF